MTTNLIKNPTERKSIFEMTDLELSLVDQFQDANRGFVDNSEPALENSYNLIQESHV